MVTVFHEKEPESDGDPRIDPNKVWQVPVWSVTLSYIFPLSFTFSKNVSLAFSLLTLTSSPSMPVPGPTPLQSFLGGVGLALPAQALLSFNSETFGISGFIHGAARGNPEDAIAVLGLISGGFVVAAIEGTKPTTGDSALLPLALSGLLVGVGAKVCFEQLCGIE